jgi:hypothetical protein
MRPFESLTAANAVAATRIALTAAASQRFAASNSAVLHGGFIARLRHRRRTMRMAIFPNIVLLRILCAACLYAALVNTNDFARRGGAVGTHTAREEPP